MVQEVAVSDANANKNCKETQAGAKKAATNTVWPFSLVKFNITIVILKFNIEYDIVISLSYVHTHTSPKRLLSKCGYGVCIRTPKIYCS